MVNVDTISDRSVLPAAQMFDYGVDKYANRRGAYGYREINKPPNHVTCHHCFIAVQLLFSNSQFAFVIFVIQTLKRNKQRSYCERLKHYETLYLPR